MTKAALWKVVGGSAVILVAAAAAASGFEMGRRTGLARGEEISRRLRAARLVADVEIASASRLGDTARALQLLELNIDDGALKLTAGSEPSGIVAIERAVSASEALNAAKAYREVASAPGRAPADVSAELHDGEQVELRFVVKSQSAQPVRLFLDSLPWRAYGNAAVVVATPTGEPLEEDVLPIDDPGPAMVVLEPRQEMRGSLDLTARFPTLRDRRRETDLLVFWSYQFLQTMPQAEAKRAGGWLVVPSRR
jgi:hypothetical protein